MKTILLLHGWNYKNYTKLTTSLDAWENRKDFVNALSKKYKVYKLNFPGFCSEKEDNKPWNLDDYASYVNNYININNVNPDYILGYSFGGAVGLKYKIKYKSKSKLILVSPALIRNMNKSSKFIKTPKIFNPIRNSIRIFYLKYIVKTNEVKYGTKFLINSYNNIVRVNMIDSIKKVDKEDLLIIYGNKDNMINSTEQYNSLSDEYKKCAHFINGGHDIANENTKGLLKIIDNYIKNT